MANSKQVTEGRLRNALQRLLDGNPTRVKATGKLSLNKINNEAGLGHSYIHKFVDFVENEATPKIKTYNDKLESPSSSQQTESVSEVDKLKAELKRERALKEQYRKERDDSRSALVEVEALNSTLMFRLHELQGN